MCIFVTGTCFVMCVYVVSVDLCGSFFLTVCAISKWNSVYIFRVTTWLLENDKFCGSVSSGSVCAETEWNIRGVAGVRSTHTAAGTTSPGTLRCELLTLSLSCRILSVVYITYYSLLYSPLFS